MAANDDRNLIQIPHTGAFGGIVDQINTNFDLLHLAILSKRDGKSAYEVWKDQDGNENKSVEEFLASLKESGFTTQAVDSLPSTNISTTTIYAVPDSGGSTWSEYIRVGSSWKLLATHNGSGFSSALTDIEDLKTGVSDINEKVNGITGFENSYGSSILTEEKYWAGVVGNVVTTGVTSTSYPYVSSIKLPCKEGDIVTVSGTATASANARLLIFLDADDIVLGVSSTGTLSNASYTAPEGTACMVFNSRNDSVNSFSVVHVRSATEGISSKIESLEEDINNAGDRISAIGDKVENIDELFIKTELNGIAITPTNDSYGGLTKLTKQANGEYGFTKTTITNTSSSSSKLYGLSFQTGRTGKTYSLSAFVLDCDIDDVGNSGEAIDDKITLHYNLDANNARKNIFKSGVISLDDGKVLAYIVSNQVTYSGNTSLPYASYIRVPASTSFEFGIVKVLAIDLDTWDNDSDLSLLIASAKNESQKWCNGDVFELKLGGLSNVENAVEELVGEVSGLNSDVQSIEGDINKVFKEISINAEIAEVTSLSSGNWHPLSLQEDGEYGFSLSTITNESDRYGQTWGIHVEPDNTKQYNLAAAVITNVEENDIALNTSNTTAFCASYNVSQNRNGVYQGKVSLGNGRLLVYIVSEVISSTQSLPNLCGIRLLAGTSFNCGIEKIMMAYLDEWNDAVDKETLIQFANSEKKWNNGEIVVKIFDSSKINDVVTDRMKTMAGIAFWGSSTIAAAWYEGSVVKTLVKNIADNLNMPYYWGGVGGESIRAISARMGVVAMTIKDSFTIPATTSNMVALPNQQVSGDIKQLVVYIRWGESYLAANLNIGTDMNTYYQSLINPCYIANVKGYIVINSQGQVCFRRDEDGSEIVTRPYEKVYTYGFQQTRDCVQVLACNYNGGYSNTQDLVAYYKRMYDMSCSKKVLIIGRHRSAGNGTITSPTLSQLQEEEEALDMEFGLMFLNVREWMCTIGVQRAQERGVTLSQTDLDLAASGVIPDAFYVSASNVHFNTLGYTLLTEIITERMKELGYNLYRAGGEMKHPNYG